MNTIHRSSSEENANPLPKYMLPSSDLFDLIHAMSKAEKRHFKMYVARNSKTGSNYLRLFDAIEKQKTYNEEKLEEIKYGKRLASTKLFLYELILKSLRQSHAGKLVNARLADMLTEAEVLFHKSLYKQSKKILLKARKLANKHEAWATLYKIVQWEIRLTDYLEVKKPIERLSELQTELSRLANIIRQEMAYENLLGHAQILQRKYTLPLKSHQEKVLKTIIQSPMMLQEPIGLGLQSRIAYHCVWSIYHGINQTGQPSPKTLEEISDIWNRHPKLAEAQRENLIRTTVKSIVKGLCSQEQFDYLGLIELLGVLPAPAPQELEKRRFLVAILRFGYGLHTNDLAYCRKILAPIQAALQPEMTGRLTHYEQIYLYHQLAIYYFLAKDFTKAIDWLEVAQSYEQYGFFNDFYHFSRLLQLLIYYEQEHYSLVESKVRSIEHYIKTTEGLKEIEQTTLKCIKDILRAKTGKEEKKLLEELYNSVSDTSKNSTRLPFKNNVIRQWLVSKISVTTSSSQ